MADITKAVDLLLQYNSRHFEMNGNFHLIHMWVAEGCDMDRDILPAMKQIMDKKKDIKHVAYFTQAVIRARDTRLEVEKAVAARKEQAVKGGGQAARMKSYAFMIRKLNRCMPQELRELEEYEKAHGPVAL